MPKPFVPGKPSCQTCTAWTRAQAMQPAGICRASPPTPVFVGVSPGPNGSVRPNVQYYYVVTADTDYCRDGYEQRLPEEIPEIDLSKIAVEAIEGSA